MRPAARRALAAIQGDAQPRIDAQILALGIEPRPPGVRRMRGRSSSYRVRVGAYRIVFRIDDEDRLVEITHIGHRRDVYR